MQPDQTPQLPTNVETAAAAKMLTEYDDKTSSLKNTCRHQPQKRMPALDSEGSDDAIERAP